MSSSLNHHNYMLHHPSIHHLRTTPI